MTNGRAIFPQCVKITVRKTRRKEILLAKKLSVTPVQFDRAWECNKKLLFRTLTCETFLSLNEEVFDQLRLPISRLDQSSVSLIGQVDINSLNREKVQRKIVIAGIVVDSNAISALVHNGKHLAQSPGKIIVFLLFECSHEKRAANIFSAYLCAHC